MSDIVRGHTFVAGEVVEAQTLNDLVSNAVIQPTFVSEKVLKDPAAMSDRLLIEDSGTLKGITLQQIIDLVSPIIRGQAVPVGTVCDFAGSDAPENWMFGYGQLLDRDVYADLFAVLGTTYSAGDGTTTFGLPDYRGFVIAGRDNMGGTARGLLPLGQILNASFGETVHGITINEIPAHTHPLTTNLYTAANEGGSAQGLTGGGSFAGRVIITAPGSSIQPVVQGGNQPHNNLQPTIIANKIIKVLNA